MAIAPAASPSRPSVKFTALDHALTMTMQNSTNTAGARVTVAISRTYDSSALPGVSPSGLPELQCQHAEEHRGGQDADGLRGLVEAQVARAAGS